LAWLGSGLGGLARLKYGTCVTQLSSSSRRVGWDYNNEISSGVCGLPLDPMTLIFAPVS